MSDFELKPGMLAKTANGRIGFIFQRDNDLGLVYIDDEDTDIGTFCLPIWLDERGEAWSIVEVREFLGNNVFNFEYQNLLWKYEEPKTEAQIALEKLEEEYKEMGKRIQELKEAQ